MISSIIIYLISCIVFIITFTYLCLKKSTPTFMIRFTFFWVIITVVSAHLFFPLYYQKEAIIQGAYPVKIQNIEPFFELRKIFQWSYPENLSMFLKQHILSSIIPMICIGILLGFLIRMNIKTWPKFFLISSLVCLLIEVLKLFVCFILQSWYLTVTPEDAMYILIGCIIGAFILCIIRKILEKFEYENPFMSGLKYTICSKSQKYPRKKEEAKS